MWYAIITIIVLIYFLVKSKSDFFKQDRETLAEKRNEVVLLLKFKGLNSHEIDEFTDAYDFFCKFTTKFDGATFVKDLHDLPNLDLDAMYHDFQYIFEGANRNFIKKFKSDLKYIKNMEKNGKGIRVTRFILLTLSGILFVPYSIIKNELFRKI